MNYIYQVLGFYDLVTIKPLSAGQIALWHALMHINNKCAWTEWFTAPNSILEHYTGLSRKGIYDARNRLSQLGYIKFESQGTRATKYKICKLNNRAMPDTTQDTTQTPTQDTTQTPTQGGTQTPATLNKPNETKPNTNRASKDKASKKEADALFEDAWKLYPVKRGKAGVSDTQKKELRKIGLEELTRAIDRYKKDKPDWQKYQYGSTFFNKGYVDYLDENYQPTEENVPLGSEKDDLAWMEG